MHCETWEERNGPKIGRAMLIWLMWHIHFASFYNCCSVQFELQYKSRLRTANLSFESITKLLPFSVEQF